MGNRGKLATDTILNDRYLIGAVLGEGGFGITYVGFDRVLQHSVAIKEFFPADMAVRGEDGRQVVSSDESGAFEEHKAVFREEAASVFGIFDLKGVCNVLDYFEENGTAYIVEEYLSGGTLKAYLAQQPKHRIPAEECAALFGPVMEGLCSLHTKGIVHKDISPDNLMLDGEGNLHLIDFGASVSRSAMKMKYAAPEQLGDGENVGPWTDVFSLCMVMYQAISGKEPPSAMERIQKDTLGKLSSEVLIPAEMEEAILRGLSLNISQRFFYMGNLMEQMGLSAEEVKPLLGELRNLWGENWLKAITESRDLSGGAEKRLSGRIIRRIIAATVCVAVVFGVAAGGLWLYVDRHPEPYLRFCVMQAQKQWDKENRSDIGYYTLRPGDKRYEEIKDKLIKEGEENKYGFTIQLNEELFRDLKLHTQYENLSFPFDSDIAKKILECCYKKELKLASNEFYGSLEYKKDEEEITLYATRTRKYTLPGVASLDGYITIVTDPGSDRVRKVEVRGDVTDVKRLMRKALPMMVPEASLTEKEIKEITAPMIADKQNQGSLKAYGEKGYDMDKDKLGRYVTIENHARYKLTVSSNVDHDSSYIYATIETSGIPCDAERGAADE